MIVVTSRLEMRKILVYIIGILLTASLIGASLYMAYLQKMSDSYYPTTSLHAIEEHGANDTIRRDDMLMRQIHIHYVEDTAIVTGAYSQSGLDVDVLGSDVSIRCGDLYPAEYTLTGNTSDGSFKISGEAPQTIILNEVSITSATQAAINIQSTAKTTLLLPPGTTNRLTDGTLRTDTMEESDACLFTEGTLSIFGKGSLIIQGRYGHAIASDNQLLINRGDIHILSAVKDGLHAKNDFIMTDGSVQIPHFAFTPDTTATRSDGIDAKRDIRIYGGSIDLCHHGERGRGIRAGRSLEIHGGTFCIETTGHGIMHTDSNGIWCSSSACCIKSHGDISISRGHLTLNARGRGGKCISADNTITLGILQDDNHHLHMTMHTEGAQVTHEEGSAKAIKADGDIIIHSGTLDITTLAYGAEGIESKQNIYINQGDISINAHDDAINAVGRIIVNGGCITALSTGNDALDSNYRGYGAYTQTGGSMTAISLIGDPEEGIDCDQSPLAISGGTLFTAGGSMGGRTSMPNNHTAKQPVALLQGFTLLEGTHIKLHHAESLLLAQYMPGTIHRSYVLISTPDLTLGNTYRIMADEKAIATYTQATSIEHIICEHPEEFPRPPFSGEPMPFGAMPPHGNRPPHEGSPFVPMHEAPGMPPMGIRPPFAGGHSLPFGTTPLPFNEPAPFGDIPHWGLSIVTR